jgi:murein DD-endopeptidase MepM/ murein hydrolase activator NlpD
VAIVTGNWKRRVLLWALPIAFAGGFGAGSMATRVAMVPEDPFALAHWSDTEGGLARVVSATPAAGARPAPQAASPRPAAQAASERSSAQADRSRGAQAAANHPAQAASDDPAGRGAGEQPAHAAWRPTGRVETGPTPLRPAAELSVSDRVQASPMRALLLAATAARRLQQGGLSSDAELTQEARLTKAALRAADPFEVEQVTVQRGDTLSNILDRAQIDAVQAHALVQSLRGVYDPRRLKVGQELQITAAAGRDGAAGRDLMGLALDLDFDHQLRVTRGADGSYSVDKVERPQRRELVRRAGSIDDSLFLSADRADVPRSITIDLIRLFSWDVDFQRDIRAGDGFEALFEEVSLEGQSEAVRGGDLLYAGLSLSGETLDAFRFELEDGEVEYFDRTGRSLRKFLLRTPVDGARLSSTFGMRRHPILGYSRMHKGVDFAAPSGTPIYAAGSGRVAAAGRNGGYGNYVRIRHSGEYSTAYAHMSRFAKGIKSGQRVRQGQVIGYVGTTGRSTGPHLHYEVLRNDQQVNPLKIKQPPTTQLAGADLERFNAEVARIDRLRGELPGGTQVASKADRGPAIPVAAIR